jgi:hypothetical protein
MGPRSRQPQVRNAATRITDEERGGDDHVNISPERGTFARSTAGVPWAGNDTSWRNEPQNTMTIQVLGASLLVCLGLLLGSSWTIQALQPKLRQQAEERRRLNEEWLAVRTARRQCSRCGSPLTERCWYFAPTLVEEERPDDDDRLARHLTAPRNAR